jgi:hypothetical protein
MNVIAMRRLSRSCALVSTLLIAGCVTRQIQHRIEVKGGATTEEKAAFASSLVTQARYERLKQQLTARFPNVTDKQLSDNIGIRWDVLTFKSFTGKGTSTTVFVSVLGRYAEGFNPEPIVEAAVEILEPEVNPPSSPSPPTKGHPVV